MPERPLLRLPEPIPFAPRSGPQGRNTIATPTRERQGRRLQPRFRRLMDVAENPERLLSFRDDPASIAPERAIVFEVAGSARRLLQTSASSRLGIPGRLRRRIRADRRFPCSRQPRRKCKRPHLSGDARRTGTSTVARSLAALSRQRENAARQGALARTILKSGRRKTMGAAGSCSARDAGILATNYRRKSRPACALRN